MRPSRPTTSARATLTSPPPAPTSTHRHPSRRPSRSSAVISGRRYTSLRRPSSIMVATLRSPRLEAMQEPLMAWAAVSGRDLPWRRTRDPWAVLVSEAMLQQTQVPRVVPKYRAFMEQFPTAAATAAVPVAEVVRAWAGLGYNRRAVGLHRAAVAVVDRHGGVVPGSLTQLLALPGVGPYTARAVLAFAYETDVGVVEVNTARVLARAVAGHALGGVEAQALADRMVPPGRGWAWNQAMVDLGATVCTRSAPSCERCPLRPYCRWALAGR